MIQARAIPEQVRQVRAIPEHAQAIQAIGGNIIIARVEQQNIEIQIAHSVIKSPKHPRAKQQDSIEQTIQAVAKNPTNPRAEQQNIKIQDIQIAIARHNSGKDPRMIIPAEHNPTMFPKHNPIHAPINPKIFAEQK